MAGRGVRRLLLCASLPLALLLTSAPGVSAASCIATASGAWTSAGTWLCGASPHVPDDSDTVLIPAGRTVSVADGDTLESGRLTLRGTLALGDESELDASGLTGSGGAITGPQYAMLVVTTDEDAQATVDSAGLSVTGAYLNVTGAGTLALAGPLRLRDGGWVESDVDATWTGTEPWQIGGVASAPASGFEMFDAQLTIAGATAAQTAAGGGAGVIQLDGGASLVKGDATTTTLDVGVLIDSAEVHVDAGRLSGRFQGAGSLWIAPGAALVLAGNGLQVAPPAFTAAGGVLEVAPGAGIALTLPVAPALRSVSVGAGATLDVAVDDGTGGPVESAVSPAALADEIAIAAGATLSMEGGAGSLALADHDVLSGAGTLDGSLANDAGTVAPQPALQVKGAYAQGAGGTLAIDLRSAGDGDVLRVGGAVSLAGALQVATAYAPGAAAPLVLGAAAKPTGTFAKVTAPLRAGHSWTPVYGATGVSLAAPGGGTAPARARPALRPAVPVVGGRTRCLPAGAAGKRGLKYVWLRAGKPIAGARSARYRVRPADGGRALACRITTATGGSTQSATSKPARVRVGLRIGRATVTDAGRVSVTLRCARGERRCSGALLVVVLGRAIARGHFAVRSPGRTIELAPVGGGDRHAGEAAVVRATYRNAKGEGRAVARRIDLN